MPIVPQYAAGAPAQAPAPVLMQERRARVDSSGAIRGLYGIAERIAGGAAQMPGAPSNLGQGRAAGVQAIGEGVKAIGQVQFDIAEKAAQLRNRADLHAAELELQRQYGEFEKWRTQNPDPDLWEKEWADRIGTFADSYVNGKTLAPAVIDAVKQRAGSFAVERGTMIGVDAIRQKVKLGGEAMMADLLRAKEAKDFDGVTSITRDMVNLGVMGEDDAVRLEIQMKDSIEAESLQESIDLANALALRGDYEGAKEKIRESSMPDSEKTLFVTKIEMGAEKDAQMEEVGMIDDPAERIAAIKSGKFNLLTEPDKVNLINESYREMNDEVTEVVRRFKEEIDVRGAIPESELESRDDFKALPEIKKAGILKYINKERMNDASDFATMLRTANAYEAAKDPRGDELANIRDSIVLRFHGEKADQLNKALDDAMSRKVPQSATERVMSDFFSSLQNRYDNGEMGGFRLSGDKISKRKDANGVEVYTTPDPDGQEFPGMLGTYRGRVIELSEQDRLKFEEKGRDSAQVYEDLKAKESAFSRFLEVQQEIERRVNAGELTSADEIQAAANSLLGTELESAFESRQRDASGFEIPGNSFGGPSNALFPSGDPVEKLNALKNATGY